MTTALINKKNGERTQSSRAAVEWPTVALAASIYMMWAALTYFHAQTPDWLLFILGGWVVAWHSSFQHEAVHGHPTKWRRINTLLASPALSLWLPFEIYRSSHLLHHKDERLTDPTEDPESKYLSADQWAQLGVLGRAIANCQASLLGRMTIGSALLVGRFLKDEFALVAAGDQKRIRIWLHHLIGVAFVAFWLTVVCDMSIAKYIACFAYPATALLTLRSFAEHRAARKVEHRTAVVENASIFALLFLNNNLHAVHHNNPAAAWYSLPQIYATNRNEIIEANGGLVYDGYAEVVSRYLLAGHDQILHPDETEQTIGEPYSEQKQFAFSIAQ
ncbi:MAG TPA: fatty acid desaturase [Planktothrix sp.]|jgi:fatty acid desaturase